MVGFFLLCFVFGFLFSEYYFIESQIFMYSVCFIPLQSSFLKLKLSHLWPMSPSRLALFQAQLDVPGSPCTLPHPDPESVISLKIPDSFQWKWYLETKIWVLGGLTTIGLSVLLDPSNGQSWREIYMYTFLNMFILKFPIQF